MTKINEYQKLIKKLVKERGYDNESVSEVFLLLVEEVGELGKAIRKNHTDIKSASHSKDHSAEEEQADIFWLVVDLANRLDIDLEEAFNKKEVKNKKRVYR